MVPTAIRQWMAAQSDVFARINTNLSLNSDPWSRVQPKLIMVFIYRNSKNIAHIQLFSLVRIHWSHKWCPNQSTGFWRVTYNPYLSSSDDLIMFSPSFIITDSKKTCKWKWWIWNALDRNMAFEILWEWRFDRFIGSEVAKQSANYWQEVAVAGRQTITLEIHSYSHSDQFWLYLFKCYTEKQKWCKCLFKVNT